MKSLMLAAATAALLAACSADPGQAQSSQAPMQPQPGGAPVETRAANGKDQAPAFAGQTRAPEIKANVAYDVTDHVTGIAKPWGLAFLPDGGLLITEKPGRLRLFKDGALSPPVAGVPAVDARDQGGLLGLAIDPGHAQNGLVYLFYAEPPKDGKYTAAVARGRLVLSGGPPRLEGVEVIWRQTPALASTKHYGGRLVFARDGTLFITGGERSITEGRMQAQKMDGTLGKVVRINADGSVPKDNPYVGQAGARPEIYSIGHRNILGAALHPRTGDLWEVEHGARGGDELNIVRAGKDYGWPTITYGVEYAGGPITGGITQKAGMEQPIYYWDPVIAPGGMAFYTPKAAPAWNGSLFVTGLGAKHLARLTLDGERVVGEERLLTEVGERLRDVVVGPDGALYVATDSDKGASSGSRRSRPVREVQAFNATRRAHTSSPAATGAHRRRSIRLRVIRFRTRLNPATPTATQVSPSAAGRQDGRAKPARDSTTPASAARIAAWTTAAPRSAGGKRPTTAPPMAATPQGAPRASAIWKPTTTAVSPA
ncbi:MAG: PQQ-dependent sugar dehydrogenase [Phenylobacterium sp.]|nr:PQQ-dependent sugar dehydrogenase [Phenylobacterium sp.]